MGQVGRPSLYTPHIVKRISDALRLGATYKMAAQYGGVSYDTVNDWMNKGKKASALAGKGEEVPEDLEPFLQFHQELQKAEADAVMGWLAKIEKEANDGNWQAAAWKLERRYPRDYSRNVTEVVGDEGGPVKVHFYLPSNGRDRVVSEPEPDNQDDNEEIDGNEG